MFAQSALSAECLIVQAEARFSVAFGETASQATFPNSKAVAKAEADKAFIFGIPDVTVFLGECCRRPRAERIG
jgi:hypothetical protein